MHYNVAKSDMLSRYVIVADIEMLDRAAFNLIVNFERVLERQIPQADMRKWLGAAAYDGGIPENVGEIEVIMVKSDKYVAMKNFDNVDLLPTNTSKLLDNSVGTFNIRVNSSESGVGDTFVETMDEILHTCNDLQQLVCVPATEYAHKIATLARRSCTNVTILSMQPVQGTGFSQESLSYSLFYALGINEEELKDYS